MNNEEPQTRYKFEDLALKYVHQSGRLSSQTIFAGIQYYLPSAVAGYLGRTPYRGEYKSALKSIHLLTERR